MYGVLKVQISIPPVAALSNPIYTPLDVGVVGFTVGPEQYIAPDVILLVVRIESVTVREGEPFPFTCILKIFPCHIKIQS